MHEASLEISKKISLILCEEIEKLEYKIAEDKTSIALTAMSYSLISLMKYVNMSQDVSQKFCKFIFPFVNIKNGEK